MDCSWTGGSNRLSGDSSSVFFLFEGEWSSFSKLSGSSSSGKSSFKSSSGDYLRPPFGENCFLAIDLDGEVAYYSLFVRSSTWMSELSDTAYGRSDSLM